jgi:hypothetical protein
MMFHPVFLPALSFFWLLRPGCYPANDNGTGFAAA